jgi:hypothetical protein
VQRSLQPDRFLGSLRDQTGFGNERVTNPRVGSDGAEQAGQAGCGGVVAGQEEPDHQADDLLFGQPAAFDLLVGEPEENVCQSPAALRSSEYELSV